MSNEDVSSKENERTFLSFQRLNWFNVKSKTIDGGGGGASFSKLLFQFITFRPI